MSRFYHAGPDYNVPEGVKRLPLALQRDPYPRRPEETREAAAAYLSNQPLPVMYLPQRMGFTKWKTPPSPVAWGSNVLALMDALEQGVRRVQSLNRAGMGPAPHQSVQQAVAVRQLNPLPQVSDDVDPNLNVQAPARGALPLDRFTSAHEMDSYVRETRANIRAQQRARNDRLTHALEVVSTRRAQVASVLGSRNNLPWFMQAPEPR